MTMLNETDTAVEARIKLLLIGMSKVGKTHFAAMAAEAGFFVLYVDGDVALPTLKQLPESVRKRIYYLDVADRIIDGQWHTRFADFVKDFAVSKTFLWNESLGQPLSRKTYDAENHRVAAIAPGKMGLNTVLVFDSWTSYAASILQWKSNEFGIDVGEMEKMDRSVYATLGNKATQTLQVIQHLPCHAIVIAHADEIEKKRKPTGQSVGAIKETDMILENVIAIPKSTSRPHSLTLPKHFTDVGWLEMKGQNRRLDFKPSESRVAGGHFTEKNLNPENASFAKLVEAIGGKLPTGDEEIPWLTRYGPGEYQLPGAKPATTLNPTAAPTKVAVGGLGGLIKKGS